MTTDLNTHAESCWRCGSDRRVLAFEYACLPHVGPVCVCAGCADMMVQEAEDEGVPITGGDDTYYMRAI